jgi:lipid-A-disaccharide synthase
MGIPMVIVYRLAPLSYWVGRLLVKVPFIGLPNILSEKGIVRELIQDAASPENIAHEILHILNDEGYAATMRTDLAKVRDIIGTREGSVELAQLAETMLKSEGRE